MCEYFVYVEFGYLSMYSLGLDLVSLETRIVAFEFFGLGFVVSSIALPVWFYRWQHA